MGRAPREYSESGVYHAMFRGANKQDVFLETRDYEKFLEILLKLKQMKGFNLYAYCLMTNHVHLVIKEKELRDISEIMKRLIGEYTQWFNFKYDRTGSLSENRYKSCTVKNDEYFMHLVRYVHQNPVKAGLANIEEYPWSSYSAYVNEQEQSFVNTNFLFDILPKHSYEEFHREPENNDFELYHYNKLNDEDLIQTLKSMGIDNPKSLLYMPLEKRDEVLAKIKGDYSIRCITRVTGLHRTKII